MKKYSIALVISLMFLSYNANSKSVLITGSNSGIGLEFTKQYAESGWIVYATHRRDSPPKTLLDLQKKYKNVVIERMDVTKHDEIDALAKKLKGKPIDVLINNAGIFIKGGYKNIKESIIDNKAQVFGSLDYAYFDQTIETNTKGPIKISEAFYEHVKNSEDKTIVAISSLIARIEYPNRMRGLYWYEMSKSALNKLMTLLAFDAKKDGVKVVMFHPGGVLVEKFVNDKKAYPPEMWVETPDSVSGMIKIINNLKIENTGKFYWYNGKEIPR